MKVSIVITTLNEEKNIELLLSSLVSQTKKPEEIIFIDGGSADKTSEIIKHFGRRYGFIKLIEHKSSRSEGRNMGIEIAKNEIIAITDAGCVAKKSWLKKITEPFESAPVDVSAGFYKMVAKNDFQNAETIFLGVLPKHFGVNFLPSSRSIAFKKSLWEKVGGYPENLKGAGEDMLFNFKILKSAAKIARVKSAIVYWKVPDNIKTFFNKIYSYAKGDSESRVWRYPTKDLQSHNIKAISVILRYVVFLLLLIYGFTDPRYFYVFIIVLFLYLAWSFRKVFVEFGKVSTGFWGIILQVVSDIAVSLGLINGLLKRFN